MCRKAREIRLVMKYKVNEIFNSWQGEGFFTGTPCTFIRLSGCNLNCEWCDTDFLSFSTQNIEQIMKKAAYRFVVITGGEPTIQNIQPLIIALQEKKHFVAIETNGLNAPPICDWISMSPKNGHYNKNHLAYANEIKLVVDNSDLNQLLNDVAEHKKTDLVWLQPEGNKQKYIEQCQKISLVTGYRVGHQIHKLRNWR